MPGRSFRLVKFKMPTRRVARVSQAVLETVSTTVLFQLRDPRIKNATILRADVAEDLRTAKIYVSVRGSDRDRALCLQGLDSSRGFIQKKVADRIQTRWTPVLKFVLEDEASAAAEATRILDELSLERVEVEVESSEDGDEALDPENLDSPEAETDEPVDGESAD